MILLNKQDSNNKYKHLSTFLIVWWTNKAKTIEVGKWDWNLLGFLTF